MMGEQMGWYLKRIRYLYDLHQCNLKAPGVLQDGIR